MAWSPFLWGGGTTGWIDYSKEPRLDPGSRTEVSNWPCEACRSSRPCPCPKNEHHADDHAVPDRHPPWLLPAPLLLYLSEGIDLGSSRLKLMPDGSPDQSSPLGPLRQDRLFPELPHGLGLDLYWSLQQLHTHAACSDRLRWCKRFSYQSQLPPRSQYLPLPGTPTASDPYGLSITSFASGSLLFWAEGHWLWREDQWGLNGGRNGSGLCHGDRHEKGWPSPFRNWQHWNLGNQNPS